VKVQPLAVALVHHPVLDKRGDEVTTAVTNLDLHDIARAAATYGVSKFYLVTPVAEQQRLVERMVAHWTEGYGAGYNPDRAEALGRCETVENLDAARSHWESQVGKASDVWLTGAKCSAGLMADEARGRLREKPALLVLGTGWGLAPQLFERGWPVLKAIEGTGEYNHLSVRAAAAIYFDRLLGESA
jgi:hypothetical protein